MLSVAPCGCSRTRRVVRSRSSQDASGGAGCSLRSPPLLGAGAHRTTRGIGQLIEWPLWLSKNAPRRLEPQPQDASGNAQSSLGSPPLFGAGAHRTTRGIGPYCKPKIVLLCPEPEPIGREREWVLKATLTPPPLFGAGAHRTSGGIGPYM